MSSTTELEQLSANRERNPDRARHFGAWRCGPCRLFSPTYEKAAEAHPHLVFAKVETAVEPDLAAAGGIVSIRGLIAWRDGLVFNQPGTLPPQPSTG